jgi:hypothetical protein
MLINRNYYGTPKEARADVERALQVCVATLVEDVLALYAEMEKAGGETYSGKNGYVSIKTVPGTLRGLDVTWKQVSINQHNPEWYAFFLYTELGDTKFFRVYSKSEQLTDEDWTWDKTEDEYTFRDVPYYMDLQLLTTTYDAESDEMVPKESPEWYDVRGYHKYSFAHPIPYVLKDYIYALQHPYG